MAGIALKNNQGGLTFVELLIAMLAMTIIMGGLTAVFMSQSRMSVSEEELIDLQMNLRVATDRLTRAISHAGFGCYEAFSQGKNLEGITSFVSSVTNGDSDGVNINPDSATITYGFALRPHSDENVPEGEPEEITVTSFSSESKIEINFKATPAPSSSGHKSYIAFFPSLSGNYFYEIDAYDDTARTIEFEERVEDEVFIGSRLYLVVPHEIYIDSDNRLNIGNKAYASSVYWIVAEKIHDLQFQYFVNGKWWNDLDSNNLAPQDTRKIRFWLLGKSDNPVRESSSQVYEVIDILDNIGDTDQCVEEYTEDGINYCVVYRTGPFNDNYLRMLSRSEVVLRNVY